MRCENLAQAQSLRVYLEILGNHGGIAPTNFIPHPSSLPNRRRDFVQNLFCALLDQLVSQLSAQNFGIDR